MYRAVESLQFSDRNKRYKRYLDNRELRNRNSNVRKIRDGKPVSFWNPDTPPNPVLKRVGKFSNRWMYTTRP
jgi:hypothetical protein